MFKKLSIGLAALLACVGLAIAGGNFNYWPIVGGAAYQCSNNNGTQVCTVPAGPSIITGNEYIPADTNLPQGIAPQTILFTPANLGAGPYQYSAPLTGASVTILPQSRRLVIDPAGTIAALTVVFPAATLLVDGQMLGLCSTQVVTALTLTAGTGSTILNGPTALAIPPATGAGTCYEWTYRLANTSWYRTQ
jgi:hypothetical protein